LFKVGLFNKKEKTNRLLRMLVRGSNYVRMDMGQLSLNKNHHRYRRMCIISKNMLMASVFYVLRSKD